MPGRLEKNERVPFRDGTIFKHNRRDLGHMTITAASLRFLSMRRMGITSPDQATVAPDTASTLGFNLPNRSRAALWNERDTLCI
jgi:hypothetical protein